MEEISYLLLAVLIPGVIILWQMRLSPMARSTNELERLNEIWEKFNQGVYSKEQTRQRVESQEWKYHKDKVELLKIFLTLTNS